MAVAVDATMLAGNSADGFNQQVSGATTISSTGITVGASASLLVGMVVLGVSAPAAASISMTWNAVSMTAGPTRTSSQVTVAMFYLINPASGAKTLTANWTNSEDCYMSAVSFTGTDTATGITVADSTSNTQALSITITSDVNGATVAVWVCNGSAPAVNFTKIWSEAPLNPGGGGTYTLGGTSNAHTFNAPNNGSQQAAAGIHVIAAPAPDIMEFDLVPGSNVMWKDC